MESSNGEELQHLHKDEDRGNYAKLKEPQHEDKRGLRNEWGELLDIVLGEDRTVFVYVKLAIGIALGVSAFILVVYSAFEGTGKCTRLGCFW